MILGDLILFSLFSFLWIQLGLVIYEILAGLGVITVNSCITGAPQYSLMLFFISFYLMPIVLFSWLMGNPVKRKESFTRCNPGGYCYYVDDPCDHFFCEVKGDIMIPGAWFYEL